MAHGALAGDTPRSLHRAAARSSLSLPQPSLSPRPSLSRHSNRYSVAANRTKSSTESYKLDVARYLQKHARGLILLSLALTGFLFWSSDWTKADRRRVQAAQERKGNTHLNLPFQRGSVNAQGKEATGSEGQSAVLTERNLEPYPNPRLPSGNVNEKYLAYFPHSGYHNQRISLENALTVAKMLDRTLLVPPVWLGHSIPYISFDKMYDRLLRASKYGLEHCNTPTAKTGSIPQECLGGYWDYTIVSWQFLVDMDSVARVQPIIDRLNMSYAWIESNLGLDMSTDAKFVKDSILYEYRLYDTPSDTSPLDKFANRLNVEDLRMYDQYRLLHFGTLFGTTRLHLSQAENIAARSHARQSMVFRNAYLDEVTDAIMKRLGGPYAYVGLHLRLGDGIFQKNAPENTRKTFENLCRDQLGLAEEFIEGLIKESAVLRGTQQRLSSKARPDEVSRAWTDTDYQRGVSKDPLAQHQNLQGNVAASPVSLPPLPIIKSRPFSPLHPSLSCRGHFHANPALHILNTPVFLATDSKNAETDSNLAIFFDTFPCIFLLSDFESSVGNEINKEPMPQLRDLQGLRNKADGVKVAPFLYPLVDAMVAAKGRYILGTPGSTFSRFAVDVLHQVYHDWPIVERG